MKRILFLAAIIAATTITATAQEVVRNSVELLFVPSTLTYTGKPAPVGYDRKKHECTIFDTEFNVVKRFNDTFETSKSRSYTEITTVKPSGAIVDWERSWDINDDPENNVATTLNEMIELLSNYYPTNNWLGFTDYKGRTGCCSPDSTSYFLSEWLGTSYPRNYFCIEDGHVKEIYVEYDPDFDQTTIDNAEWTIEGDVSEHEDIRELEGFDYDDFDANNSVLRVYAKFTQTLFNDDDKWEFIEPKYGAMEKSVGDYWTSDRSEDGWILRRRVEEKRPITGFDIKNEDGETIASINEVFSIDEVIKIGGNIYFAGYSDGHYIVYKYDPKSTDIKEVSRSEAKMANIRINGRSIMVEADAKDVDEVELIDMGGRKMASSDRKGVGNLTINTPSAADGVYSVALKKRGRLVGAQKIILK